MKQSEALTMAGSAGRGSNRDLEKLLRGIVNKNIGEKVAFQADLAGDADGAAIAAAVNGLRDALVAAGIMAAE